MISNRYFYYEVDGVKFYNNISAFQHLSRIRQTNKDAKIKFVLNFDFFKNYKQYNWDKEPPETASYYMRKHAIMLYRRHKNLVLWYTGGTDSHPIANTFAELQLPIHLVWCDVFSRYWNSIPDDRIVHLRKDEWEAKIKPDFVEWFNRVNKDKSFLKFSEVALVGRGQKEIERYLGSDQFVGNYSCLRDIWNLPGTYLNEDKIEIDNCVISGYEKPSLIIHNGWWCHAITDSVVAQPGRPTIHNLVDNHIWFYMTDLVPELHIKLTWNRMRAIERVMIDHNLPMTNEQAIAIQNTNSIYYKMINDYCGYNSVNTWLGLPGVKQHRDSTMKDTIGYGVGLISDHVKSLSKQSQHHVVDDYWKHEILQTIDERYLNIITNQPMTIKSQMIPIKPVEDIRNAKI